MASTCPITSNNNHSDQDVVEKNSTELLSPKLINTKEENCPTTPPTVGATPFPESTDSSAGIRSVNAQEAESIIGSPADECPRARTYEEVLVPGIKVLGKCKWFNVTKGFGFVTTIEGGHDIFVHQTQISSLNWRSLHEGEEVLFMVHRDINNKLQANQVTKPDGTPVRGHNRPRNLPPRGGIINTGVNGNLMMNQMNNSGATRNYMDTSAYNAQHAQIVQGMMQQQQLQNLTAVLQQTAPQLNLGNNNNSSLFSVPSMLNPAVELSNQPSLNQQ